MNTKEKYAAAKARAKELIDLAKTEERELTEAEYTEVEAKLAEAAECKALIERARKSDELLASLVDVDDADVTAPVPAAAAAKGRQTPGEIFIKSEPWQALLKAHPNGFQEKTPIPMAPVAIGGLKTLVTDPGLTSPRVVVDNAPVIIQNVLQAFTVVPDAGEAIKHMTATFTNNAAVVAEGAAKPESALAWTPETLNPVTYAHHIPVTVQALRRNSQLESLINTFMVDGVVRKVAAGAVAALAAHAGLTAQAFSTDLRTTIRRAITKASQFGTPSGILLNAFDAENVDLEAIVSAALGPGQYYAPAEQVWRLPIFTSFDVAAGFAYVGDLKNVMVYLDGPVQLATGWINTQFTENELTIRAEQDAVTGVFMAPAIVKADLTV